MNVRHWIGVVAVVAVLVGGACIALYSHVAPPLAFQREFGISVPISDDDHTEKREVVEARLWALDDQAFDQLKRWEETKAIAEKDSFFGKASSGKAIAKHREADAARAKFEEVRNAFRRACGIAQAAGYGFHGLCSAERWHSQGGLPPWLDIFME